MLIAEYQLSFYMICIVDPSGTSYKVAIGSVIVMVYFSRLDCKYIINTNINLRRVKKTYFSGLLAGEQYLINLVALKNSNVYPRLPLSSGFG